MRTGGRWRTLLVMALISGALLALPSGALALSGKPVQIGTSDDSATPAVVVDPSGTAYVAWTVPTTGTQEDPDQVAYCMIPAGAASCSATGTVTAPPGNPAIGNVALTLDGGDVVLVADQFLASSDKDDNYVNEWLTPDGSANFAQVDSGESVSPGQGYGGDALFDVPTAGTGGGPLGYGFSDIGYGNFYVAEISPFNAPPECSEANQSTSDTCSGTPEATLATPTGASSQTTDAYAAQTGATPGVLGVFHTNFAATCDVSGTPANAGLSYVYGSGDESATNSYGISPGAAGSAWKSGVSVFDCDAGTGVPVSGAAGLGVLEDNWASDALEYRIFNQTTDAFSAPATVDASEQASVSDLQASQDANGGVYATYENGNTVYKGPNDLSYSPDGGAIWDGPVALTNLSEPLDESVSAVGSDGQGWLVWADANNSGTAAKDNLYVQQFSQQDVPPDATTLSLTQTVHGAGPKANAEFLVGTSADALTATLAGTNADVATGAVTYKLLTGGCGSPTEAVSATAATFSDGKNSLTFAGVINPGTYDVVASYPGDRNNAAVTSKCGANVLTVDSPTPIGASVMVTSHSVSVPVTCTTTPCAGAIAVLTGTGLGAKRAARLAAPAKAKAKTVTLASGHFKIAKRGHKTLVLTLSAAGKRLLAAKHGGLTTTVRITATVKHHKIVTTRTVKLRK